MGEFFNEILYMHNDTYMYQIEGKIYHIVMALDSSKPKFVFSLYITRLWSVALLYLFHMRLHSLLNIITASNLGLLLQKEQSVK